MLVANQSTHPTNDGRSPYNIPGSKIDCESALALLDARFTHGQQCGNALKRKRSTESDDLSAIVLRDRQPRQAYDDGRAY